MPDAPDKGLFAPRNPRAWRLAILAVLAALAAIVALTVSGPSYRLRNVHALLERPLSRLLGFDVSIAGPVFVKPSLRPWVSLHDVHLRDARGDSEEEALTVRELRVRINPFPILLGHWSIARVEMTEAQLCVSSRPESACNWQRALAAIDKVTNIDQLTIRGLQVRCTGGACGKGLDRRIAMISANLPAHGGMQVTLYAEEVKDPPLAQLSAASWSDFRADRPLQVHGALQSGATRITFDGVIQRPRELSGVTLDLDGRADLGRWHQVVLGEMRVHGRLEESADGYHLLIDRGKWGTGTVSADVTAKRSNPGLAVNGSLAAHHVDLDPWVDAPAQGRAAGGFADVDARFTTTGDNLDAWREHMRGYAQVAAGPAELPIDQVERWSKGFLKFVFSIPQEGAATHVNCMRGAFELRGDSATTSRLRLDTAITRMRAVGSLALRSGEMDFLVKPQLKKGPLKYAPLVAVSGRIEQPVSRLASADEAEQSKPLFERIPVEPRDPQRPCE